MKYKLVMLAAILICFVTRESITQQNKALRGLASLSKPLMIRPENGLNILDLSNNGLEEIEGIATFKVTFRGQMIDFKDVPLSILRVNNNNLQKLPAEIAKLKSLVELDASYNQLEMLPDVFSDLKELRRLVVAHNQLVALPDSLTHCKMLSYLQVNNNKLKNFPQKIGDLSQLKECYVSHNNLVQLPASFAQLKRLAKLDMRLNKLSDDAIELILACSKLTHLDLGHNHFTALPEEIKNVLGLTHLKVDHNKLTSISSNIGLLKQLALLDIGHNQLKNENIPDEIANVMRLSVCNVSFNRFFITADFLLKFPRSITNFNLSGNTLVTIDELSLFTKLKTLNLSFCELFDLPRLSLPNLIDLNISHNNISTFPQAILGMASLRSLDLSYNQLTAIPDDINTLTHLVRLDVSYNTLTSLSDQLAYAVTQGDALVVRHPLEYLDISNNKELKNLPENFGDLTSLRILIAENTGLITLPDSFGNLSALEYLNLNWNKHLRRLPYSFIKIARYPEHIDGVNSLKRVYLLGLPNLQIGIDQNASEILQKQQKELRHFVLQLIEKKIAVYAPDLFNYPSVLGQSSKLPQEIKQKMTALPIIDKQEKSSRDRNLITR